MAALDAEDFQSAAPLGEDILILSSDKDEPMDDQSPTLVFDLQFSSDGGEEDEEIERLMSKCGIRQDGDVSTHPHPGTP